MASLFLPEKGPAERWWSLACGVVLCLTPIILFPTVVFGKQIWTVGDLGNYNFPLHIVTLRQWRSGTIPLWNPYLTSGTPLAASMQGGVFYPLNWVLTLLPDGAGFTFSILAHVALTGIFTFAYLRSIQLSRWASLIGALVFQLGGFTMSHLGHVAMLRTIPWLPWVLLALQKWSDYRDWRWVCLGAFGLGCSFLAGYPQTAAYSALTTAAYGLFLLWQAERERWRFLVGGIILFVLGAGVASVQLVLTAASWNEYMRVAGASFEYFALYSLDPGFLVRLIFPRPGAEMNPYVGVPTLLLAASNLLVRHPRRTRRVLGFYAALAVIALLLAFGRYTVLAQWTYRIPIYGSFSVISRHLLEFNFAFAVVAAFGVDLLRKVTADKPPAMILPRQGVVRGTICLSLLIGWAIIWVSATAAADGGPALVWDGGTQQRLFGLIVVSLMALGVIWLTRRVQWPHLAPAVLFLWLFADLGGTNGKIYTPYLQPFDQLAVPSTLETFLEQEKGPYRVMSFVLHGNDPFFTDSRRPKWLFPNFNMLAFVESATGFDAVILAQLDQITNGTLPTHGLVEIQALYDSAFVRYLNLAGAKYLVVPSELVVPADLMQRYEAVFENEWVRVLLNTAAFPRIFYVPQFETATFDQSTAMMRKGEWDGVPFDPHTFAVVEGLGDDWSAMDATAQAFGSTLALLKYELVPGITQGDDTNGDWQFATWWACRAPVPDNYTLYVHLLDETDAVVAQADHLLGQRTAVGFHPTQTWSCPALIKDVVSIPAPILADLDAVRIAIGVWKPETGERLEPPPGTLDIDQHGRALLGFASDMVSTLSSPWNVSDLTLGEHWLFAELDLPQDGVVVHSSNYSAGWSGRLDGQPVPVVRVNGFLQGLYVPAGHHRVEFVYRPIWFYVGAGISVLTLGLMVIIFWVRARRNKTVVKRTLTWIRKSTRNS